jgi:hypothetical protein
MDAVHFSDSLVIVYQTRRHQISEDSAHTTIPNSLIESIANMSAVSLHSAIFLKYEFSLDTFSSDIITRFCLDLITNAKCCYQYIVYYFYVSVYLEIR